MITDPAGAPPRPDLTFLRHRGKPRPPAPSPVADFVAGRGPHPPHTTHHATPPAPEPSTAEPSMPSSLDLSARPARSGPPAAAVPSTSSLDLSAPAARPAPAAPAPGAARSTTAAPSSGSLDLSDSPAPGAPAPSRAGAPARRVHRDRRIAAGQQQLLTVTTPTVTLTRVQSGIGHLEVEAVCAPEVGDLRLGAAYQFATGETSTVQYAGGNRFAPPSARRPLIVAGRDEYEHLRIDLRQVRRLERLAIYAFSESRTPLAWGGTLVATTFGGARIELPLEGLYQGTVAVLMSIYDLDGELVIRAEMETITGDVREAARAYGYDRITWRDDRHPVE